MVVRVVQLARLLSGTRFRRFFRGADFLFELMMTPTLCPRVPGDSRQFTVGMVQGVGIGLTR